MNTLPTKYQMYKSSTSAFYEWIDKGLFKDYYIPKYIIEGFVNALDKLKDELLKVGYYG